MSGEGKTVCVTGGAGYIGSWLVKCLLDRGYTVKATVRDLSDPKKTEHLLALDGAEERLQLFEANLLEEGSFDSVVEGCDGVFHSASPVYFSPIDPQAELIDPAVKGTLNVLESCAKVPSVKRVIITSSMASVVYPRNHPDTDTVIDETWFSDPLKCKDLKLWYARSKTLAENAAWEFAEEKSFALITIHPTYVIGPLLQPTVNESVKMILDFLEGHGTLPTDYWSVDVRDVAEAHIQAFEIPAAAGRYCLVERLSLPSEVLQIVKECYPGLNLPAKCGDENLSAPKLEVSKEKAKTLGINFTPLETTLRDTIESLKEKGFLEDFRHQLHSSGDDFKGHH